LVIGIKSSSLVRLYINSLVDYTNARNHEGFLFIKCRLRAELSTTSSMSEGVQLLALPPKLRRLEGEMKRGKQRPSLNIILTGRFL